MLEEIRIRTVERVQAGESPETVIATLGFTRRCIYEWLARYRSGGWSGLKAKALAGPPKKISVRQMEWLWKTITGTSPLQHRFEFALWTRQMVQILLWEEFQLKFSLPSISRLPGAIGIDVPASVVSRKPSRIPPESTGGSVTNARRFVNAPSSKGRLSILETNLVCDLITTPARPGLREARRR
jgi:transposase